MRKKHHIIPLTTLNFPPSLSHFVFFSSSLVLSSKISAASSFLSLPLSLILFSSLVNACRPTVFFLQAARFLSSSLSFVGFWGWVSPDFAGSRRIFDWVDSNFWLVCWCSWLQNFFFLLILLGLSWFGLLGFGVWEEEEIWSSGFVFSGLADWGCWFYFFGHPVSWGWSARPPRGWGCSLATPAPPIMAALVA